MKALQTPQNIYPFSLDSLLEKAESYGLPLEEQEKNNVFTLHDIITIHEWELNELTKRTAEITELEVSPPIDISNWEEESLKRAQAAFARIFKRVQDNPELSPWQVEVLDKANHYKIPYNVNDPDWFKLSDHIEELELLITEAEEYGIYDWDANDLIDIRQRIEEAQHRSYNEYRQNCCDYRASRL